MRSPDPLAAMRGLLLRGENLLLRGREGKERGGEGNPPKVQVIEVNRKTLLEYGIRFYTGNTLCYAGEHALHSPRSPSRNGVCF